MRKSCIAILSSFWGPANGGINSFNADFCAGMAAVCKGKLNVICVVRSAQPQDIEDACQKGIILLPLAYSCESEAIPSVAVAEALKREGIDPTQVLLWVGHDRFTGLAACECAKLYEGKSAVIRHMDYYQYESSRSSGDKAVAKLDEQRKIFDLCDYPFAVGPLLQAATQIFYGKNSGRHVRKLVPGLAHISPKHHPKSLFTGITFGRISAGTNIIKQGDLTVKGFTSFAGKAKQQSPTTNFSLHIYGLPEENELKKVDEREIRNLAENTSIQWLNVVPCSYTKSRNELFDRLSQCNVCLMPSRHEGFGLVGWEAIAATVPLIVSENSGLYRQLVEDKLQDLVVSLAIYNPGAKGTKQAVQVMAQQIDAIFTSPDRWEGAAVKLLSSLKQKGYTWLKTASDLLSGSDIRLDDIAELSPQKRIPLPCDDGKNKKQLVVLPSTDNTLFSACMAQFAELAGSPTRLIAFEGPGTPEKVSALEKGIELLAEQRPIVHLRCSSGGIVEQLWKESGFDISSCETPAQIWNKIGQWLMGIGPVIILSELAENIGFLCQHQILQLITQIEVGEAGRTTVVADTLFLPQFIAKKHTFFFLASPEAEQQRHRLEAKLKSLDACSLQIVRLLSLTRYGLAKRDISYLLDEEMISPFVFTELERKGLLECSSTRWSVRPGVRKYIATDIGKDMKIALQKRLVDRLYPLALALAEDTTDGGSMKTALEWVCQASQSERQQHINLAFDLFYKRFRTKLLFKYGQYETAIDVLMHFFKNDGKVPSVTGKERTAQLHKTLGYALGYIGASDEAWGYLEEFVAFCHSRNRKFEEAGGHGVLALIAYARGEYDVCYRHLRDKLSLSTAKQQELSPTSKLHQECILSIATTHRSLAKLFIAIADWSEGDKNLQLAENAFNAAEDKQGLGSCYIYRASLSLFRDGDPYECTVLMEKSKSIQQETATSERGDIRDTTKRLILTAQLYSATGQFDRAINAVEGILISTENSPGMDMKIYALNILARVQVSSVRISEARAAAERAYLLATLAGYKYMAAEALVSLALCFAQIGDTPYATRILQQARTIAARAQGRFAPERLMQHIAEAQTRLN